MTSLSRILTSVALAAIVALATAPVVLAAPPGAGGGGPAMAGNPNGPRIGQYADTAAIDALKGQLAIKPGQETAWSEYAKVLQGTAADLRASRGQVRSLSPEEQQARQQKAFDTVKAAADTLLPALDATQQATARQVLPGVDQK